MTLKAVARDFLPPVVTRTLKRAFGSIPKVAGDELMVWMGFVNPGMLSSGNIDLFAYCLDNLPSDAPVIEIGSWAGLSLNHIVHFLRRSGRRNPVFSVDEWRFENARFGNLIDGSAVSFDDYRSHLMETFRRNVALFSGDRLPHHIQLGSDAFFAAWDAQEERTDYFGRTVRLGGPISFAYVDGDHTYAQSKKDFENIDRHLEAGGFIVFDDSGDDGVWEGQSNRTAREAAGLSRYELIARNPNYCIRKKA